jgi:hypothetical protein
LYYQNHFIALQPIFMLRTPTIFKSICWLFLVLVLHASFVAVYQPLNKQLVEQTTQTNNADTANSPAQDAEQPTWSETLPFDAVVHVALQCQFLKVVFALPTPVYHYFANILKEKITAKPQWSALLLSYFQNIFKSAILINAP